MSWPYQPQTDRMVAALKEIPRDQWHSYLFSMLFTAMCPNDLRNPPPVEEMRAFANRLIEWCDRADRGER